MKEEKILQVGFRSQIIYMKHRWMERQIGR